MLKVKLLQELSLSTSKLHALIKKAGLEVKDEYTQDEVVKIKTAMGAAAQPQAQQPPTPNQHQPNPKTQTGELAKAAQARTAAIAHQIEALERRDDALCTQVGVKLAEMIQARPAKIEAAFNQAMEGYTFDWDEFLGVQHLETAVEHFRLPSSSTVDCLPAGTEG